MNQYKNEIWFKILKDSTFLIVIKKTKNEINYQYEQIKYDYDYNGTKQEISYQNLFRNELHSTYFREFLNFLKLIEKEIFTLKEYNNFELIINLRFQTNVYNNTLKTECKYKLEPDFQVRDTNILYNNYEDNIGLKNLKHKIIKRIKRENFSNNKYIDYSILELEV